MPISNKVPMGVKTVEKGIDKILDVHACYKRAREYVHHLFSQGKITLSDLEYIQNTNKIFESVGVMT
jgi:hypothetical protein